MRCWCSLQTPPLPPPAARRPSLLLMPLLLLLPLLLLVLLLVVMLPKTLRGPGSSLHQSTSRRLEWIDRSLTSAAQKCMKRGCLVLNGSSLQCAKVQGEGKGRTERCLVISTGRTREREVSERDEWRMWWKAAVHSCKISREMARRREGGKQDERENRLRGCSCLIHKKLAEKALWVCSHLTSPPEERTSGCCFSLPPYMLSGRWWWCSKRLLSSKARRFFTRAERCEVMELRVAALCQVELHSVASALGVKELTVY